MQEIFQGACGKIEEMRARGPGEMAGGKSREIDRQKECQKRGQKSYPRKWRKICGKKEEVTATSQQAVQGCNGQKVCQT